MIIEYPCPKDKSQQDTDWCVDNFGGSTLLECRFGEWDNYILTRILTEEQAVMLLLRYPDAKVINK
jgi:hypothetical protein